MKARVIPSILLFSATVLSFGQSMANWGTGSLPGMGSSSGRSFPENSGRISGNVFTTDGRPQRDALVQIHDFSTRSVVASVYTSPDGGFNFDMLPSGTYEVVANYGTGRVTADVNINGGFENVTLRLNTRDPNAPPTRNGMVSISELKAPQRARDAYAKAEDAALKGRPEEVFKNVRKALQIYPDYAPALTLRAAFSLDKDNVALAVEDLDKAIHADSTYALAHAVMAAALNRMNKFDEALRAADIASTLSPHSWQPYFEMANSYFAKTDYQRALQQLTHAQSELVQDYAPLHFFRAKVLLRLSDYNDALNELQTFLKIAPNDPKAASVRDAITQINTLLTSGAEIGKAEHK